MSLLDLRQFSAELIGRRNKAALLLTPNLAEQRSYAAQIATEVDGTHLDVLDLFQSDESLTAGLPSFSMDDLFALIGGHKDKRFLVVSGIEFLLAAWLSQGQPKEIKRQLGEKIELWQNLPPFILVTHQDSVLAGYEAQRFTGGPVVIHMSQTLALE
jgi:hypothetical protein